MYKCEYCDNIFSRSDVLRSHQRKARYCLVLQGKEIIEKTPEPKIFKCQYCNKQLSRSDNLKRHEKICTRRDNDQQEPQGKLQDTKTDQLLQTIVELLSDNNKNPGTTNINNKVNMNLAPITEQDIKDQLDRLSLDFIFDGARGYANYAYFYPLKDKLICTDKARKKLRYNRDGEMVEDGGGLKLAQLFFQAIASRNEELINTEYGNLQQQVVDISQGNAVGDPDLVKILTKSTKLQDLLISCQQTARGEINDLSEGFIRHLSKHL